MPSRGRGSAAAMYSAISTTCVTVPPSVPPENRIMSGRSERMRSIFSCGRRPSFEASTSITIAPPPGRSAGTRPPPSRSEWPWSLCCRSPSRRSCGAVDAGLRSWACRRASLDQDRQSREGIAPLEQLGDALHVTLGDDHFEDRSEEVQGLAAEETHRSDRLEKQDGRRRHPALHDGRRDPLEQGHIFGGERLTFRFHRKGMPDPGRQPAQSLRQKPLGEQCHSHSQTGATETCAL